MLKRPTSNCSIAKKRRNNRRSNIFFNIVLCEVGAYTGTVFTVALHDSGTRKALLGSQLNNTEIYLTPFINLVLEITQLQDHISYTVQLIYPDFTTKPHI